MNIAIVDDMQLELSLINMLLDKYSTEHQLNMNISPFSNAEEFLEKYHPNSYDLIFLDIYLEGMSGVDAAKRIREIDSHTIIIFLTSSQEYMRDAFYLHAYDYIEKPATKERVFHTMNDIIQKHHLLDSPKLTFTSNRIEYRLAYSDIVMINTGSANYLEILDKDGNTYQTRMTFQAAQDELAHAGHFLLVIRGVLVNMDYITDINDKTCYIKGNITQPVNFRNYKKIKQEWIDYIQKKRF